MHVKLYKIQYSTIFFFLFHGIVLKDKINKHVKYTDHDAWAELGGGCGEPKPPKIYIFFVGGWRGRGCKVAQMKD